MCLSDANTQLNHVEVLSEFPVEFSRFHNQFNLTLEMTPQMISLLSILDLNK